MFKVIVVGGPCGKFINKCISSILTQEGVDLQILISLDSYDDAQHRANVYSDPRIRMAFNDVKQGGLANICSAVSLVDIDDDDIMCFIDGDDWLIGTDALKTVQDVYDSGDVFVTHGGWKSQYPNFDISATCLEPYTEEDFKDIRKAPWRATALKTMKYKVFRQIDKIDFRHDDGSWITRAGDHALMMPAVEMAGYHRTKCITEKIYFYNRDRTITDGWNRNAEADAMVVRLKKPYKEL